MKSIFMSKLRLKRLEGEAGFTIVELMIATLIFTIILVVVTVGVLSFTKGYYKGLNSSATQTRARSLLSSIAQGIQYAGGANQVTKTSAGGGQYGCIKVGNVSYNYYLGRAVDGTAGNYGVYATTNGSDNCDATSGTYNPLADTAGRELLSPHMRLTNIDATNPSTNPSGVGTVEVGVAYGDTDLLCSTNIGASSPGGCNSTVDFSTPMYANNANGKNAICKSSVGSQFCAVTHLNTTIQPRLAP